jgi:type I restriction enzyme, R subunit
MSMNTNPHHEIHFEDFIVDYMVNNGWIDGKADEYDEKRALYPEDVIGYLKDTQSEAWKKLESLNGSSTETIVLDRVVKALQNQGTLEVIRRGVNVAGGGKLILCQSLPEDDRNETIISLYNANRLRVVRQINYAQKGQDQKIFDLVFFINGIPVATAELKSDFTQSVQSAITQYRNDRNPKDKISGQTHPLLTFKRGALVHFAVSTTEIYMTTKLAGAKTFFLPFNLGHDDGPGNPPTNGDRYPVAYLWERILQPDNWVRIFQRFMLIEKKEKEHADGRLYFSETMIFPRFHQWEAVTSLIDTVREEKPGHRYLIQHSAGSGKTNSISWICHELIRLKNQEGSKYFNSVIVVTDRNVLDSQLQDAIKQIDHQDGVVNAVDRVNSPLPKSQQLAEALISETPIVVVTIQTFPHAMEAILSETSLKDRTFAVIIDEAHTSQTGLSATKLRAVLAMDNEQEMAQMTPDMILERLQKVKKFPTNVSYFAFTATPKHSTLTLFGRAKDASQPVSKDNPPVPFHTYTMRQAIEEEFIKDVLKNYTAYSTAYQLGQKIDDKDKRVDKKYAKRSFAKWLQLHPTNVSKKIEFIVEHFLHNVAHLLGGHAKAMIVTGSRAAAVKYKIGFDASVNKKGYSNLNALVAFSGKVQKTDIEGLEWDYDHYDEKNMNPKVRGRDLRKVFDTTEFNVMIVANKFQTGFDQPKLVAMYLDKKISGVEAVQTLSRLNRTYPGKKNPFVIDFINDPGEILKAFRLFYREAEITDIQDPNIVYDIKDKLDSALIYMPEEVERFGVEISKDKPTQPKLHSILKPAEDRFNSRFKVLNDDAAKWEKEFQRCHTAGDEAGADSADIKRSEMAKDRDALMKFKEGLSKFVKMYEYIAQLIEFGDPSLESFSGYARLLRSGLDSLNPEEIDLKGLKLTHYGIKGKGRLDGVDDEGGKLNPVTGVGTGDGQDRERTFLSQLIEQLNNLFGEEIDGKDKLVFAIHISGKLRENKQIMDQVKNNSKDNVLKADLPYAATTAIFDARTAHEKMATRLLSDEDAYLTFMGMLYEILKRDNGAQDLLGNTPVH